MTDLNVTYSELTDAAGKLRAGQQEMDGKLGELSALVRNLTGSGFQTDHASVAFNDTFTNFETGLRTAIDALDGLAAYLDSAAKAMEETDTQLAAAIKGQG